MGGLKREIELENWYCNLKSLKFLKTVEEIENGSREDDQLNRLVKELVDVANKAAVIFDQDIK